MSVVTNKSIYDAIVAVWKRLSVIEGKIDQLAKQETGEMALLDNLTTEVARQKTVDDSIITLLNGLVAQLQALANQPTVDPAALQALVDQIKANDDALANAVVANTPTTHASS